MTSSTGYQHDTTTSGGLLDHLNAELDAPAPALAPEPEPEAPVRRQPGQLVECLLEDLAPFTVRVANRELIAYEKTAARHKEWPTPTRDNPELGRHFQMTFCTFAAARRAGLFEGTFEVWCDVLEDWNVVSEAPADPTQ